MPWAVVGCDGIKSRVRQIVLGEDNPASYPHYSHQSAYRALIEMDKALAALGHLPSGQLMYLGPRAHINTYPVGRGKFMNFVAFIQDKNEWPDNENLTAPASKADVVEAFSKFGPAVRAMIDLLPTSLIDGQSLTPLITHSHPSHMTASVLLEMRLMPALRITVLGRAWVWKMHWSWPPFLRKLTTT